MSSTKVTARKPASSSRRRSSPARKPPAVKAGVRTSEFAVLVLTNLGVIAGALAGTVPPRYAVWLAGGSSIAYTLARSIVKAGSS